MPARVSSLCHTHCHHHYSWSGGKSLLVGERIDPYIGTCTVVMLTLWSPCQLSGGDELVTLLDKCIQEISQCLWSVMSMHSSNPHVLMMTTLLDHIRQLRGNRHIYTAMQLLQKVGAQQGVPGGMLVISPSLPHPARRWRTSWRG